MWDWDARLVLHSESRVQFSPACHGQSLQEPCKNIYSCKVFCLPGFPLKVVSHRSESTQMCILFIDGSNFIHGPLINDSCLGEFILPRFPKRIQVLQTTLQFNALYQ